MLTTRSEKRKEPEKAMTDFSLHISLIGPMECGKTTLMRRFSKNKTHEVIVPTTVSEVYSIVVPLITPYMDQIRVPIASLDIEEISGEEKYKKFWKSLMNGQPVVLLMYDCQNRESYDKCLKIFETVQTEPEWHHVMYVLVAAKKDPGVIPKVPMEEAKRVADGMGWLFFKLSGKNDRLSKLEEKFSRIATAAIERWWKDTEKSPWDPFFEPQDIAYRYIS